MFSSILSYENQISGEIIENNFIKKKPNKKQYLLACKIFRLRCRNKTLSSRLPSRWYVYNLLFCRNYISLPGFLNLITILIERYQFLNETLYPPPSPCSILKLSRLNPKYPSTLFPMFFSPPITYSFLFSLISSTFTFKVLILSWMNLSPGFSSSNFLYYSYASSLFL